MPYRAPGRAIVVLALAASVLIAGPASAQTKPERGPPAQGMRPQPGEPPRAVPEPLETDRRPWREGEDAGDESRAAPFNQGCPDRGNKLELIV